MTADWFKEFHVKKFDKRTADKVVQALEEAMQAVAAAHGLTVRRAGGKFTESGATFKFDVAVKNPETGEVGGTAADTFKSLAPVFGLKKEDLGREFVAKGMTHRVVGCKTTRTSKPILTKGGDGRDYVWPAELVKMYLERAA